MNFRNIKMAGEIQLSAHDLNNAVNSLIDNKEFIERFVEGWKKYYKSFPLLVKPMYEPGEITESMLEIEIVNQFKNELNAFKEQAGSTPEEIIAYIIERASDWMDPNRLIYIYIEKYFGADVKNGKVMKDPEGWFDTYRKYKDVDKFFEWAYEKEYEKPFIREYDMTQSDVNQIKNEVLSKYKNMIGEYVDTYEEKEGLQGLAMYSSREPEYHKVEE